MRIGIAAVEREGAAIGELGVRRLPGLLQRMTELHPHRGAVAKRLVEGVEVEACGAVPLPRIACPVGPLHRRGPAANGMNLHRVTTDAPAPPRLPPGDAFDRRGDRRVE